eukprot:TRINITY_DN15776_c0_g1_i3.p1 TRINITY_DN15776_c0_g1~~TRINITY_DN15776_c0_g1_i3.p1  ORF type:complete len:277 (+),score=42.22 TRINITY_DN15776_c0_g1_i3:12-842(+)
MCMFRHPRSVAVFFFNLLFFFKATATTEIYTLHIVGSVRCVQETGFCQIVQAFLILASNSKPYSKIAWSKQARIVKKLSTPKNIRSLIIVQQSYSFLQRNLEITRDPTNDIPKYMRESYQELYYPSLFEPIKSSMKYVVDIRTLSKVDVATEILECTPMQLSHVMIINPYPIPIAPSRKEATNEIMAVVIQLNFVYYTFYKSSSITSCLSIYYLLRKSLMRKTQISINVNQMAEMIQYQQEQIFILIMDFKKWLPFIKSIPKKKIQIMKIKMSFFI